MGMTLATAGDSAASVIARADAAHNRAKQQGRNRWVTLNGRSVHNKDDHRAILLIIKIEQLRFINNWRAISASLGQAFMTR